MLDSVAGTVRKEETDIITASNTHIARFAGSRYSTGLYRDQREIHVASILLIPSDRQTTVRRFASKSPGSLLEKSRKTPQGTRSSGNYESSDEPVVVSHIDTGRWDVVE